MPPSVAPAAACSGALDVRKPMYMGDCRLDAERPAADSKRAGKMGPGVVRIVDHGHARNMRRDLF